LPQLTESGNSKLSKTTIEFNDTERQTEH